MWRFLKYIGSAAPPIEYNVALLKIYGWGERLIDFRISIFVLTAPPICHPRDPEIGSMWHMGGRINTLGGVPPNRGARPG